MLWIVITERDPEFVVYCVAARMVGIPVWRVKPLLTHCTSSGALVITKSGHLLEYKTIGVISSTECWCPTMEIRLPVAEKDYIQEYSRKINDIITAQVSCFNFI